MLCRSWRQEAAAPSPTGQEHKRRSCPPVMFSDCGIDLALDGGDERCAGAGRLVDVLHPPEVICLLLILREVKILGIGQLDDILEEVVALLVLRPVPSLGNCAAWVNQLQQHHHSVSLVPTSIPYRFIHGPAGAEWHLAAHLN